MPIKFEPQLADSVVGRCKVEVAGRHNTSYRYGSLNVVVDFIDSTYRVVRHNVSIPIAGEHGEWEGIGFGRLYQDKVTIATGVRPSSLRSIVVWQAMKDCDKIVDIENVGIIVTAVDN